MHKQEGGVGHDESNLDMGRWVDSDPIGQQDQEGGDRKRMQGEG